MSFKKIVSTASRDIRDNEKDGWDYYFMSKDEILKKKTNDELLQFISFGGQVYGYEYSEFSDVDELIVVSGGSGAGKDTLFNLLAEEHKDFPLGLFGNTRTKFLFSIPATIPLFVEHAKELGIGTQVLHLHASEETRLERILLGVTRDDPLLSSLVPSDTSRNAISIKVDKHLNVETRVTFKDGGIGSFDCVPTFCHILEKARARIFRDRESPFEDGIAELRENGYDIETLDISELGVDEAKQLILTSIKEGRDAIENIPLPEAKYAL